MTPKRHLAALLLAAFAVVGLLRVPCLFGSATAALASQAAELPPCHGAPVVPEDDTAGCPECASLHSLVGAASAVAPAGGLGALLLGAPAWCPRPAPLRGPALARSDSARALDPLRRSTVRLL
jgi:hypothetical protein